MANHENQSMFGHKEKTIVFLRKTTKVLQGRNLATLALHPRRRTSKATSDAKSDFGGLRLIDCHDFAFSCNSKFVAASGPPAI